MLRGWPCHVVGFPVMSSKYVTCPCFAKYLPGPGSTSALVPVPGRCPRSGGNDGLVNVRIYLRDAAALGRARHGWGCDVRCLGRPSNGRDRLAPCRSTPL
eukprot:9099170-Pyramimonas_sp.AAC.1